MANIALNARLRNKIDTFTNWTTNNPILFEGEIAVVVVPANSTAVANEPAILFKVGDGTTAFNSLSWVSAVAADVYEWAKAASKPTYTASEIQGLEEFISGEIKDTNTQYQIVQDSSNEHTFSLQKKDVGDSEWTTVNTITIPETVYTLTEGTTNGTVSFNGTDIAVKGLNSAAYVDVDTLAPMAELDSLEARVAAAENDITLKANTSDVYTKTEVDNKIAAQVGSVYKPAGSIPFEELPTTLTESMLGNVYNITNAFTATNAFISSEVGKSYPADSNVAVVDVGTSEEAVYKYDVLSGFVDLSNYATIDYVQQTKQSIIGEETDTDSADTIYGAKAMIKTEIAALSPIAKSGNINDLIQTDGDLLIINCGTSILNM